MHDIKSLAARRIQKFQALLQERGLDAAVILKPENVFYFSNFNPVLNSHPCFVLIPAKGEASLLVHSLRCDHATEEGALDNILLYGKWGANVPIAGNYIDAITTILPKGATKIGFEFSDLSIGLYEKLQKSLGNIEANDITANVLLMKIIKDEYEIDNIRRSAILVDAGVETAIHYLNEGYSEARASTEGQYRMRNLWHDRFPDSEVCGFGTSEGGMIDSLHVWCLSNEHIAFGCDCPRHYQPKAGDLTLPMAWAKTNGYHAENERTIIIGALSGVRERAYEAMLEARQAVFAHLKPGNSFESLYLAAAGVYTSHGFEDILPGRVGHGVGCSAHEYPSLEKGNSILLAPGMVFTVEPGLMDKAWGGVRHSDTVLITEHGYECLTKLNQGRIVITPPTVTG